MTAELWWLIPTSIALTLFSTAGLWVFFRIVDERRARAPETHEHVSGEIL